MASDKLGQNNFGALTNKGLMPPTYKKLLNSNKINNTIGRSNSEKKHKLSKKKKRGDQLH